MIEVNAHPDRAVFLEHGDQLGRDALRQRYGNARSDADKFNVRDGLQGRDNMLQHFVA